MLEATPIIKIPTEHVDFRENRREFVLKSLENLVLGRDPVFLARRGYAGVQYALCATSRSAVRVSRGLQQPAQIEK